MESLKEKTAKGLFWSGLANVMQQVVGLLFGIILGRLLTPGDYGMIGMITVFSAIASLLQNSGFRTALVNHPNPQPEDYNSVFWFNVLMSLTLYTILFFCAPYIAEFYHTPDLVILCRYAFLGFVMGSLSAAQLAYLTKNMKMKAISKATIIASLASSVVGVVMAWMGCGYWSLATQTNAFIGLNTLLLWVQSDWRPTLHIDFGPVKRMLNFSLKVLFSQIFTQINNSMMNVLLGRFYGKQQTGYYSQGYQWSYKCYYTLQGTINQVDQPVLAGLHDQQERQLQTLRKLVRFIVFLSMPLLLGFGLVAKEFIVLTITERWLPSAVLLQLLCISGSIMPLSTLLSDLVLTKGKSGIYMWVTLALCIALVALLIGLHPFGIKMMTIGYVILNVAWVLVWFFFVHRLTGYRLIHFLKDVVPFAAAAIAVMVATHFITLPLTNITSITNLNLGILLAARVVIAAGLYYAIMRIAGAQILKECIAFIRHKKVVESPED